MDKRAQLINEAVFTRTYGYSWMMGLGIRWHVSREDEHEQDFISPRSLVTYLESRGFDGKEVRKRVLDFPRDFSG